MKLPFDEKKFVSFNMSMFPKRKTNSVESLIDWRIKSNPNFTYFDGGLISMEKGEITGQIIPIYSKFISNNNKHNCVWGSDYIVAEKFRGGSSGIMVVKSIIKNYLHFGVGMSEISLKIHKTFRETEIGTRYDCLFISKRSKVKDKFQVCNIDDFLLNFNSVFSKSYTLNKHNFFDRSSYFYAWIFKKSKKKNLKIVYNNSGDFVMMYHTSIKLIPIVKIIDYSPSLIDNPNRLTEFINFYGSKSVVKIFFYSGGIDVRTFFRCFRYREFPVYSNINSLGVEYDNKNELHITGMDSDRFINNFL